MSDQNHPRPPDEPERTPESDAGGTPDTPPPPTAPTPPQGYAAPPPPSPEGAPPGYAAAPPPQNPYGMAPAYGEAPESGPVTRPRSIDLAVLLMRVGAVLSLLSVLSVFLLGDQIRRAVEDGLRAQGETLDPAAIDAAVAVATVVGTVVGLLGVALWLVMAWANGKGRSWARIAATVLFGLSALSFVAGLSQPAGGLERVLSVLSLLLGAAIVVLLWRRESSEYFQAMSGRRF